MRDEIRDELCAREEGERVFNAVQQLLDRDGFLLARDVNERSITHRLAMYLAEEFPAWDVDCEYNRDGHDPKELNLGGPDPNRRDTEAKTVYPDIIVHTRGEQDNLLVIEVKKSSSRIGRGNDFEKLRAYRHELQYRHALYIEFLVGNGQADVAQVQWFDDAAGPV